MRRRDEDWASLKEGHGPSLAALWMLLMHGWRKLIRFCRQARPLMQCGDRLGIDEQEQARRPPELETYATVSALRLLGRGVRRSGRETVQQKESTRTVSGQ